MNQNKIQTLARQIFRIIIRNYLKMLLINYLDNNKMIKE